jgi:hypothetical protein
VKGIKIERVGHSYYKYVQKVKEKGNVRIRKIEDIRKST